MYVVLFLDSSVLLICLYASLYCLFLSVIGFKQTILLFVSWNFFGFFFSKFFFLIEIQLIYSAALISVVQQSDSVFYISSFSVYFLLQIFILNIVPCAIEQVLVVSSHYTDAGALQQVLKTGSVISPSLNFFFLMASVTISPLHF